jgi:hypothetical protein
MSDDPQPPSLPEPSATAPAVPPELFQIPVQLLEEWVGVPAHEHLAVSLTRQDIDNFIFALLRNADALSAFDRTLVSWSNGDINGANREIGVFRRHHVDSQNYIRQFATALMVSALQGRKNAPKG